MPPKTFKTYVQGLSSATTPLVLLDAPGKSITIKKISATVWAAIAVNGAVDYD